MRVEHRGSVVLQHHLCGVLGLMALLVAALNRLEHDGELFVRRRVARLFAQRLLVSRKRRNSLSLKHVGREAWRVIRRLLNLVQRVPVLSEVD